MTDLECCGKAAAFVRLTRLVSGHRRRRFGDVRRSDRGQCFIGTIRLPRLSRLRMGCFVPSVWKTERLWPIWSAAAKPQLSCS